MLLDYYVVDLCNFAPSSWRFIPLRNRLSVFIGQFVSSRGKGQSTCDGACDRCRAITVVVRTDCN